MSDEGNFEQEQPRVMSVLEYVTRALVKEKDAVRVSRVDGDAHRYSVFVNPGELGRVIGRGGRSANAIRTIATAAAGEDGVSVEFTDGRAPSRPPRGGRPPRRGGRRDAR